MGLPETLYDYDMHFWPRLVIPERQGFWLPGLPSGVEHEPHSKGDVLMRGPRLLRSHHEKAPLTNGRHSYYVLGGNLSGETHTNWGWSPTNNHRNNKYIRHFIISNTLHSIQCKSLMQDKKQYIGQIITISNQNQLALYYTTIRLNHFRKIDISLTITRPCCPFINHYKETNISYNRHNIQYLVRKQAPLFNMPTAMTFDEEQVQQAKKILENDRKTREKRHALNAALIKKGIPFSKTVRFNDMMKNHNPKQTAKRFYNLLCLKKDQAICIKQVEPLGIFLSPKGHTLVMIVDWNVCL